MADQATELKALMKLISELGDQVRSAGDHLQMTIPDEAAADERPAMKVQAERNQTFL